jgi:hypothetical protein
LVIISSMADSSMGSNNSVQTRLIDDLHFWTATHNTSVVSHSVVLQGVAPPHTLGEDMLAAALMDKRLVVTALISLCWFSCQAYHRPKSYYCSKGTVEG